MSLNIVGISAHFHDSAVCVMKDGKVTAAAEEERFSRVKHDRSTPKAAYRFCLEQSGLTAADIDCVAYYEDPVKKLARQIWMGLPGISPEIRGDKEKLYRFDPNRPEREICNILGYKGEILYVDHHQAHAASSFYFSGFNDAALMTVDGVGEWATTTYGRGSGKNFELFEQVEFPDSLGLLYSTITSYLGFKVNSGEYKVMGLAPYGKPIYTDQIHSLIESGSGGQYRLNMEYFDFLRNERMYSDKLPDLFGFPVRHPESEVAQCHKDVAKSLQVVLEEILLEKVHYLYDKVPSDNLCMAGGVALNCVANGKILRNGPFANLFVQPASSDSGGALGAAAIAHTRLSGKRPEQKKLREVHLGPGFSSDDIWRMLKSTPLNFEDFRGNQDQLIQKTAEKIREGKVIGWFQGRMEFGPRALGARSILADPTHPDMRDRINAMIKNGKASDRLHRLSWKIKCRIISTLIIRPRLCLKPAR